MPKNSNRLQGEGLAQPISAITNPRERRLLLALLYRDLSRESLDRTVGWRVAEVRAALAGVQK